MSKHYLVRGARQLLTLRGPSGPRRGPAMRELGLVEDGAVLFSGGVIREVGPARRIENLAAARTAEEIDASGCVVMPGFVDSHTHLVCGPPRLAEYQQRLEGKSYQEITEAGGGILVSVRAVRTWTTRRLVNEAQSVVQAMARCGTTTVEAKSGYGLDLPAELKQLRATHSLDGSPLHVVPTCLAAHTVPPEFTGRPDDYISYCREELLPEVARKGLARFADIFCEEGHFTPTQAADYLAAARRQGMELKMHAAQFRSVGAVQVGLRLGVTSLDHLEAATPRDVEQIGRSDTIATLLPGCALHLGLGQFAPARQLIGAGAAVALATNFNPGTSPVWNMQMVVSLACLQMRMTPAEAITAATINGAYAVGLGHRCGSIESGKSADLLILKVGDYRELPYYFGDNHVRTTISRGAVLRE